MNAGTLEIQLLANLARLQGDMTQAKGMVGSAMQNIESAVASAKSVLGSLGVGLGIGTFATLVKGSIDAADHLNDLTKSTGISVESLSGLRLAAKQTGSELDGTAAAINKLSQNIGASPEKFRALGISAKDPLDAFKQLSDIFVKIEDPQQRAALGAAALGKGWQAAAPLLAEGGAQIGAMVEKGTKLSGVTQQMAKDADAFNDKLAELVGTGGMVNRIVGDMLPLLNAAADGLLLLRDGGEKTTATFNPLTEVLRVLIVLFGNVGFVLKGVGTEIAGIGAQLQALAVGDFGRFAEIGRMMKTDAAEARAAFDKWEASIMGVGKAAKAANVDLDTTDQISRRMGSEAAARAREFIAGEESKSKALKAAADAAKAAAKQREEVAAAALKAEEMFADDYREAWKYADLARNKEAKDASAARDALAKAEQQANEMFADDYAEAWRFANAAIIEEDRKRTQAVQDQARTWEDMIDVVLRGVDDWRAALKSLLKDMLAIFAKRWLLNVAAGGSVMGAAGDALAGGTGGGSLAGNLLNYGSTALGATGAIGSAYGAFSAGATGAYGMAGSYAMGGTMAFEAGSALAGVYSALAAIPVWGWIAMAVVAIGAWIAGNHKGGPKIGGSFMTGGDVPGSDNGRFFTPNQGDDMLRDQVLGLQAGYAGLAARLGGTAGNFRFGLGFDHDPQGTAMSRVSSMLLGPDGRRLYGAQDREMDDKEVPAALQLEMQRMLVGALQETDLHDEIDKIFDSIPDLANATKEQLDAVLAAAMEMKGVIDALDLWAKDGLTVEALRSMAREGESLTQTLNALAAAQQTYYSLFFTEEENQARGIEQLTRIFKDLGLELPGTRQGFRDLVEGLDLTDEAQARLYRQLLELAPAFSDLVPAVEDVADVVEDLGEVITETAQQVVFDLANYRTAANDAWDAYYGPAGVAERQAKEAAKKTLGAYLDSLLLGKDSPLSPMEKLGAAKTQFENMLKLAQAGDLRGLQGLQGAASTYLDLARGAYASGQQYGDIFKTVFDALAGVGDVADYNTRMIEIQDNLLHLQGKMYDRQVDILQMLMEIRDGNHAIADATELSGKRVQQSVDNAAVATSRR